MKLAFVAGVCLFLLSDLTRPSMAQTTEANRVVEIPFTSSRDHADPFNQIDLDVVFTSPGGNSARVPAFWAGGKIWKVRFASSAAGEYRFQSVCSDAADAGLHGVKGSVMITPYGSETP